VPIVFLERYRSAFVIFSIAIFSLLLFLALLASWLGVWCLVVVGLILVVFSLILTFASIRIGVRVRAQILKSPPSGRRQRLIRATNLIILSSIVFLLFIIAGVFNLLPVNAIWVNGTLLSHHPTTHFSERFHIFVPHVNAFQASDQFFLVSQVSDSSTCGSGWQSTVLFRLQHLHQRRVPTLHLHSALRAFRPVKRPNRTRLLLRKRDHHLDLPKYFLREESRDLHAARKDSFRALR
jgi:hypothetical protein